MKIKAVIFNPQACQYTLQCSIHRQVLTLTTLCQGHLWYNPFHNMFKYLGNNKTARHVKGSLHRQVLTLTTLCQGHLCYNPFHNFLKYIGNNKTARHVFLQTFNVNEKTCQRLLSQQEQSGSSWWLHDEKCTSVKRSLAVFHAFINS